MVNCGMSVDDQTLLQLVITLRQLDRPRTTPSASQQLAEVKIEQDTFRSGPMAVISDTSS
jgi:hypothetical protein